MKIVIENASGRFAASAGAETTDMPEFPELRSEEHTSELQSR